MAMNVVCIGSGYVGSVTAAAFAALGHRVTVVDKDESKVNLLASGRSPIYEPGLEPLIRQMKSAGMLQAESHYGSVATADAVFIAVGTPSRPDGTADLGFVEAAARSIGQQLSHSRFTVIVNKSTVPVGTADAVASILEETSGLANGEHFAVVSNPEFLREGYAVEDVFFPDRIVIGSRHPRALAVMKELYRPILERKGYGRIMQWAGLDPKEQRPETVYFETDAKSAELIKYASNAFLSVKISYINEIARLCEGLGANVLDVAEGMGLDSRIGKKFLQVSSGWSGSCFPKDTAELLAVSRKYKCELGLVRTAIESNLAMHDFCIDKLCRRLTTLNGKRIGVLGLTFKPNTDDARQTQASYMIRKLMDMGAKVAVHDPKGMEMFRSLHPDWPLVYCDEPEEVGRRADGILLLTHWDEYARLDWKAIRDVMRTPYILDTRNFLRNLGLAGLGFQYEGIGLRP